MNPTISTNPRIAMLNAAVALLEQFTTRPLADLPKAERKSILEQAVATARDMMRLPIEDFRTAVATATQNDSARTKPEWVRLPPVKGKCRYTGLGRSLLYTLVAPCAENGHKPPVRSISLRRRGTTQGRSIGSPSDAPGLPRKMAFS